MKRFYAYLVTPEFRKNIIYMALITAGLVFTAIFSLRVLTKHGDSFALPDLTGKTVGEAQALVKAAAVELKVDTVYVDGKTPGSIVQQDPDPATNIKEGRTVYLLVQSFNRPMVALPDLEGKTLPEARAMLKAHGFELGSMTYRSDIAKDVVLGFNYDGNTLVSGTALPRGTTIGLVLGDGFGSAETRVPNLIGLSLQEAIFAIRGNSLFLGHVSYNGPIPDSTNARVVLQDPVYLPEDTTTLTQGAIINITLEQR